MVDGAGQAGGGVLVLVGLCDCVNDGQRKRETKAMGRSHSAWVYVTATAPWEEAKDMDPLLLLLPGAGTGDWLQLEGERMAVEAHAEEELLVLFVFCFEFWGKGNSSVSV